MACSGPPLAGGQGPPAVARHNVEQQ